MRLFAIRNQNKKVNNFRKKESALQTLFLFPLAEHMSLTIKQKGGQHCSCNVGAGVGEPYTIQSIKSQFEHHNRKKETQWREEYHLPRKTSDDGNGGLVNRHEEI